MKHYYYSEYQHVKLRPLEESDIEQLRLLRNQYRYCFINTDEISSDLQSTWFQYYLAKDNDIMFSICCPSLAFAGAIALYEIDFDTSSAEFGRIVVSEEAPQMTGTYAIEALLRFASDVFKLNTVYCSVLASNSRAISVYERIGFQQISSDGRLKYYQINLKNREIK